MCRHPLKCKQMRSICHVPLHNVRVSTVHTNNNCNNSQFTYKYSNRFISNSSISSSSNNNNSTSSNNNATIKLSASNNSIMLADISTSTTSN